MTLRRWRQHFGISAPRVAVRTRTPWYGWAGGGALILCVIGLLARGMYDAGGRDAGFDRGRNEQMLAALQVKADSLQKEVAYWRGVADVGESRLQIERAAQQQLARQVKGLEEDNARLKDELGVFENLARTEGSSASLIIHRLRLESEGMTANRYRYHLLAVMQGAARESREFKGELQLLIHMRQQGRDVMMTLPSIAESASASAMAQYRINFRYFRRLDGDFTTPDGARVTRFEVRLLQNGVLKASRSVTV